MEDDLPKKMEDDLKQKMKMEDDLKKKHFFLKITWKNKMEDEPINQINLIGCDTIVNSPSYSN